MAEAEEFGFVDEMDAFGLQFGHGVGIGLHEGPIISRLNSFTEPIELREGMVFALRPLPATTEGRQHVSRRSSSSLPTVRG